MTEDRSEQAGEWSWRMESGYALRLEQKTGEIRRPEIAYFFAANAKTPAFRAGVFGLGSLTITYFHTGIRTIIGVESFHG
ncbi:MULTISPECIES: hypothetical protein, partial [unclassified Burkholderia]|uniref:hypothetical protein n=1 Tax=unclassified Burkholderia TaxID=2613784 RepID=UPI001C8B0815